MKRDIYKSLEEWKKSPRRKPLIINGARQVGKTYALKHFGQTAYKKFVYFNFEKSEKLHSYFKTTLDPHELLKTLAIHAEVEIEPKNTLIIFDEIQECPRALNCLKYFCEEAKEYHVAAAGSLLGVKTTQEKGFPVGKVNFLHLYPLTFFEFLSAMGESKKRTYLENIQSFESITFHDELTKLLKIYMFVGGMPEAVSEYRKHQNLSTAREVHEEILDAYEKDFAKHAPPNQVMKITTVWKLIHKQLAKENKKFIFSTIRKSARARDYEEAIQWLLDAGLIHKSSLVLTPKFPLSAYSEEHIFKIFSLDVGLLAAQSNLNAKTILDGNRMFTEFKGALTENFIAQELIPSRRHNLYYWKSSGTAEIDFLLECDHEIYPLEVKSGTSPKKKSLLVYADKYAPERLCRATLMNLKIDGKIANFPLYLVSCLF
ncbi:MAG: AAA family ATPase [Candidatus Algichlamydia australiensis]|nr:AAA family ATPase [Chlamydiales bacterium]